MHECECRGAARVFAWGGGGGQNCPLPPPPTPPPPPLVVPPLCKCITVGLQHECFFLPCMPNTRSLLSVLGTTVKLASI